MRQSTLRRTFTLTLTLSLALALLVVLTACGQKTLQKYYDEHPEEATAVEESMNASAGDTLECTFSAKDNSANYVLKFKKTYESAEVNALKDSLAAQVKADKAKYIEMITQMEEKAELKGTTCHLEYQNGDGSVIYATDITKE